MKLGIDWIELAQDRDRRRAHVNAVIKTWCTIKLSEFLN
jgi:hypothetical protein